MPFKEHPAFLPPDQQGAKIWRYMDLAKFLSVLDKASLYFTRVDQLSSFDRFEGYYTAQNLETLKFEDMTTELKEASGITSRDIFDALFGFHKQTRDLVKYHREVTFVKSWHVKEYESAAMWKLYLTNSEGIAIQSTYQALLDSFAEYADFEIHVGKIKYIDYNSEVIPLGNVLLPFMYKRKSFEHEDELRALIWTPQHGKNDSANRSSNRYADVRGICVPVNLEVLIHKVFVAPNAPQWLAELISSLVKRYNLKVEVIQSALAAGPIY